MNIRDESLLPVSNPEKSHLRQMISYIVKWTNTNQTPLPKHAKHTLCNHTPPRVVHNTWKQKVTINSHRRFCHKNPLQSVASLKQPTNCGPGFRGCFPTMDFFKAAPGSDTKSRLSIELSSKPHSENTDRQVLKTYRNRLAYHGYEFSERRVKQFRITSMMFQKGWRWRVKHWQFRDIT